jgi:hypothetical protein
VKSFEVTESANAQYTATLKDEQGTIIGPSLLTTLTLTLFSEDSPTKVIINSRDAQDILGTTATPVNGGSVSSSGVLTLNLSAADNAIINTALPRERHLMEFAWTYTSGTKTGRHRARLIVTNLEKT